MASDETQGIYFQTGSNGSYTFALRPFAGAAQGELNWGEITFKLADQNYRLLCCPDYRRRSAPSGVGAPDPESFGGVSLGSGPIPK